MPHLTGHQRAMLAFVAANGPQPWLDVVSVIGQLGDGFTMIAAGAVPRRAITDVTRLVSLGLLEELEDGPTAWLYQCTFTGRQLLAQVPAPASPQTELAL